tara:strand:- start:694 stop:1095 length:402 start_codon:yes stop_codon:yes gene_type:complete
MFPTFERQPIDVSAVSAAHKEATKALRKARASGSTGLEAAVIAQREKNNTYKKLTGTDLPGFKTEATMEPLSNYDAIGLAEGWVAGTDDKRMQAWQHLIDTGLAWQLQGGFGRTAMSLIESGICSPPKPIPAP